MMYTQTYYKKRYVLLPLFSTLYVSYVDPFVQYVTCLLC